LDFWTEPKYFPAEVDIRVDEAQCEWLCKELKAREMKSTTLIEDLQELIEKQMVQAPLADWFASYHNLSDITAFVNGLAKEYPDLVTIVNLGKSYEGKDLIALKLTSGTGTKSAIWFDGCIHAREWITTATVLYMANSLLSDFNRDPVVTNLLKNLEIWVMPVVNPDGYDYTWTTDRMWRKTRSPNAGSSCVGTDPNRNWDFHWGEAGTSPDPCSDAYQGSKAFSEIEVSTVGLYIKNAGNFHGYINFHSYSQLWMSPWGWTAALPTDWDKQDGLSANCVNALTAVFGTQYEHGNIAVIIYPASGSSADYTYGVCNILYSYGVELRDTGRFGFVLPPAQIEPSGQETYAAVKVWAQAVLSAFPKP